MKLSEEQPPQDSNLERRNQNPLCYHYTKGLFGVGARTLGARLSFGNPEFCGVFGSGKRSAGRDRTRRDAVPRRAGGEPAGGRWEKAPPNR